MDELTSLLNTKICDLDCILQIKDRERPVRGFLTDLSKYYTLVFQHVKECNKCDSNEVLRRMLNRRSELKRFSGVTSNGLVKLAVKYEGLKENPANSLLVDEFYVRCANWELTLQRQLTDKQLIRALRYLWISWELESQNNYWTQARGIKFVPRQLEKAGHYPHNALAQVYTSKGGGKFPPEEDLEELFIAAGVMTC